jgi:hypothetical protein
LSSVLQATNVSSASLFNTPAFNNSLTSYYLGTSETSYLGEWIIIKLPYQLILSRIRFYPFLSIISKNPSLWHCYGSSDGNNFTIISDASNNVPLNSTDYLNGYYEKIIPETFTTSYLYIGFVFSKIIGGNANATSLTFVELQIFGRDQTPSALYLTSLFNKNLLYYSTTGNDPNYLKCDHSTPCTKIKFTLMMTRKEFHWV